LINALPGNNFANTKIGNNRRETVFSMRSAPRKAWRYKNSAARQRSGKYASTTMGARVFRGVGANKFSEKQMALRFSSVFSAKDSHGKFVDL
jgi:hypothetical protein